MPLLRHLFACSALIALLMVACTRVARAEIAAAESGDLTAFSAGNAIPGPFNLTSAAIARVRAGLEPSLIVISPIRFTMRDLSGNLSRPRIIARPSPDDADSIAAIVDRLPVGEHMRRVSRAHLNLDDGVSATELAICYRVNGRWAVQVLPGDPAPVKLPVSSFENSEGVTIGMVMRLGTRH